MGNDSDLPYTTAIPYTNNDHTGHFLVTLVTQKWTDHGLNGIFFVIPSDAKNVGIIGKSGARGRIRTTDTRIFNPLLYQLSYPGRMPQGQ